MKYILLLGITCVFLSCGKGKSVQLPEITDATITEILDVSPAYIFYDETKRDSVELNRKNLIGTTNWLVNIDKRLTLKQVVSHLIYLQNKRNKDGMHKNENAKNYFTCNDTRIQNLGFIEFTNVFYHSEMRAEDYLKENQKTSCILVNFTKSNIFINGVSIGTKSLSTYLKDSVVSETYLVLNFDAALSFQDYITYKSLLTKLDLDNVTISNNEFIY